MARTDCQRLAKDYARIEKVIELLSQTAAETFDAKQLAKAVQCRESEFQQSLRRWAGVSPPHMLQRLLSIQRAGKQIATADDLRGRIPRTRLSNVRRLDGVSIMYETVAPREFQERRKGMTIAFGFHPTPFGMCLLGNSDRGICALIFPRDDDREAALHRLRRNWEPATLTHDPQRTGPLIERIFSITGSRRRPLSLFVKGTNFQLKVWDVLLRIPWGAAISYSDIAMGLGMPTASRAVANAVARNPIHFIIPCHRVIRRTGAIGGYQGGPTRKRAMLAWEALRKRGS